MQIGKIFKNIKQAYKKQTFTSLAFDSKKCVKGCIFFAIKSKKFNGNNFINEAIAKGANTIISDRKFEGYKKEILYLYAKNTRLSLSEAATNFYKIRPKNLLAVTGTNGKSSIANFYYQILKLNNKVSSSIGTLGINFKSLIVKTNNTTLDPITLNKTLFKLKNSKIDNVILEASSHGLDQNRLYGLKFDVGIFSNFSRDHLDYHKSYKNYLNSKLILFKDLLKKRGQIIFDNDIPEAKIIKKIIKKNKYKYLCIGKKSDLILTRHQYLKDHQKIVFTFKEKAFSFKTKLIGKIQLKNLFMAILAASKYIKIDKIVKSLDKIKSLNGRFENIGKLKNNSKVILDYSHTPDALKACISNIKDQFKTSKISIVFGCGGERDKPKRELMGKIASDLCDTVYLTDDNPRSENPKKIRSQVKKKIDTRKLIEIASRRKTIKTAIENLLSGEILIVAGKGHEDYQEYKSKKFFSDKIYIKKYIKLKNLKLSHFWKTNIINENLPNKKINFTKKILTVSTNSKIIKNNQLFVGLKGKNFDGNLFAMEAIKNNAEAAIVCDYNKSKNLNIFKVINSLKTFSKISSTIRKVANINTIAITGSCGKTSFKDLLSLSLKRLSSISYSKNSFNNKFGVPLSLFDINFKDNFGVFEVGMDKKGEIDNLSKLINPNVGVITNISYAHIKNFKSIKDIASAKSELIDNILPGGTLVINRDDQFYYYFKKRAFKLNLNVISFSKSHDADIRLIEVNNSNNDKFVKILFKGNVYKFKVSKDLIPYIENLLGVISVLSLYFDLRELNKNSFLNFKPTRGRGNVSTIKIRNKSFKLIDESYNSNPLSIKFSVNRFSSMNTTKNKKVLLLGDMLELGKFSKKLHQDIPGLINNSKVDKVYVFGKYIKQTFNKIKTQKKGRILNSIKDVKNFINLEIKDKEYLMVKGSNSTGLHKLIRNYTK